jgi:hypothetical protein
LHKEVRDKALDLVVAGQIDSSCFWHIYWGRLLDDFEVRRTKFREQGAIETVLLWLVVVITISGVALAALQLLASYKLATLGKGQIDQTQEISFEARGNVSVKSSVTGLLILIVSFAFFLVYVGYVYPVNESRALGFGATDPGQLANPQSRPPANPADALLKPLLSSPPQGTVQPQKPTTDGTPTDSSAKPPVGERK